MPRLFLFCIVFAVAASGGIAVALEPQGNPPAKSAASESAKKPTAPVKKPPGKIAPNLTEDECTGLGGEVSGGGINSVIYCVSGKVCTTKDESHEVHQVCINAR